MQIQTRLSMHLAGAGVAAGILAGAAMAQDGAARTSHAVEGGEVRIIPVEHASLFLDTPSALIAIDPVGPAAMYQDKGQPDLILLTHEHQDHFDPAALARLVEKHPKIISNPAVLEKLPDDLKANASALRNGESTEFEGIGIEAVPAYNTTPDRTRFHPQGRDNGYVLTIGGKRFYVAGDTEATDEFKAMKDIEVAFVPMNLPYTMTTDQAAEGVAAFAPTYVYPYHHKGTDPNEFAAKLKAAGAPTETVILDWYPQSDDPAGGQTE